jgi:hypothetical protein
MKDEHTDTPCLKGESLPMKAKTQAVVFIFALIAICGGGRASLAQAPTMTVTVKASPIPIPLTVVRGTLVIFQGSISQQMMMTTFALRNDYGEFAKGDFLDSWKLSWNTGAEHAPTEQIAVFWSRAGGSVTRLTRYNVKFVEATPFILKAGNSGGKMSVTITPTGTLTAQKYTLSLDGAPTSIEIDSQGSGTVDTSHFRPGLHTVGASAMMTDGSMTAIPPVSFLVNAPPPTPKTLTSHRKPAPPSSAKRKPTHQAKTHHS